MRLTQRLRKRQMQEIVSEACGLLHSLKGVRSVHIVAGSRPTYHQMRRYRKAAEHDQVNLTVDGDGVITIRQEER